MATEIFFNVEDSTYTVTSHNNVISTTVTASGNTASYWIQETLRMYPGSGNLIVSLDVEWRPSFQAGVNNMVALIQICVGQRCLIFQILWSDFLPFNLAEFLMDNKCTFVGVGIREDVNKLIRDYNLHVANVMDLSQLAADRMNRQDLRNAGLVRLVRAIMGMEIEKPRRITMSQWDKAELTQDQIKYACLDAFASFEVGRRLLHNEF